MFIYIFWLWGLQFFLKPGIWINTGIAHMVCLFLFSLVILCSHLKRKNIIFYKLIFKFFINLFFIFVFCHHNGFWCYTHPDHKKILCQKLISLGTELTKQNILWSLDGGSALGALREYPKNNFGILYEKDEDIMGVVRTLSTGSNSLKILNHMAQCVQAIQNTKTDELKNKLNPKE